MILTGDDVRRMRDYADNFRRWESHVPTSPVRTCIVPNVTCRDMRDRPEARYCFHASCEGFAFYAAPSRCTAVTCVRSLDFERGKGSLVALWTRETAALAAKVWADLRDAEQKLYEPEAT